jgi:hypothetical protein
VFIVNVKVNKHYIKQTEKELYDIDAANQIQQADQAWWEKKTCVIRFWLL